MILPKTTLFIILATLTGCQCLLHNLLNNIGRTVQGVYKCSRGLFRPPMMPMTNNFDLRIELKDGKARIWLPENRPGYWNRQMNIPRPFSPSNPWRYNSISYPNYSGIRSRALRDISSQNNLLQYQDNQIYNFDTGNQQGLPYQITPPVYQTGFRPISSSIPQETINHFPKYSVFPPSQYLLPPQVSYENFLDQELNPPQLLPRNQNFQSDLNSFTPSQNFNSDLNLPFDFSEVNNLAELNNPGSVYSTIPYSSYTENQIGNGLAENENVNNGNTDFETDFTNRPFVYNSNVPTASIDTGYGQIPLYK